MQRSSSQRQVKKVSVPLVPDIPGHPTSGKCGVNAIRNSTSSYGTLGSQEEFSQTSPSPFNNGIPGEIACLDFFTTYHFDVLTRILLSYREFLFVLM